MPEFVDRARRADLPLRVRNIEGQEAAIEVLYLSLILGRPALLLAELLLQYTKIKRRDASERRLNLRPNYRQVLTLVPAQRSGDIGVAQDRALLLTI